MPSDLPRYTLRIPNDLLQKISYIAEANGRSTNREIEMLIKKCISAYEKEHGPINLAGELGDLRFKYEFGSGEVLAAHRTDDPMTDLPDDAIESIEEFKKLHLAAMDAQHKKEGNPEKKRK